MPVNDFNQRTALLLGNEAVELLATRRITVVGTGGVGSYAVEMLARAGVGHITIVDADVVAPSNLNRQLPALHSTIGAPKVEVMKRRIHDINPECTVTALEMFMTPDNVSSILGDNPHYIIDAIDSIAPKIALIQHCCRNKIKLISSMGAGGRVDPTKIRYADISETFHDGLARVVRQRLKQCGITSGVKVVFSTEQAQRSSLMFTDEMPCKASSFGTVAWIPAIFGMMLAAYAINSITGKR